MPDFGLLIPTTLQEVPSTEELGAYIHEAEKLGFDSLWTLDRILHSNPCLDNFAVLSHAASITKRIKIGTAVLLLALRDPVLAAKAYATLDHLSRGRVIAGVSLGGRDWEFSALRIPIKTRVTRFVESIQIMRALWSQESVNFAGKVFNLKDAKVFPKPKQGLIPIIVGGSADSAVRRAGRIGDGYIASIRGSSETFRTAWEKVLEEASRAGRDPSKLESMKLIYVFVDNNTDRAYNTIKRWADSFYMTDFDVRANCVYGSVDECTKKLSDYLWAGVDTLILGPPSTDVEQVRRIKEVASRLD